MSIHDVSPRIEQRSTSPLKNTIAEHESAGRALAEKSKTTSTWGLVVVIITFVSALACGLTAPRGESVEVYTLRIFIMIGIVVVGVILSVLINNTVFKSVENSAFHATQEKMMDTMTDDLKAHYNVVDVKISPISGSYLAPSQQKFTAKVLLTKEVSADWLAVYDEHDDRMYFRAPHVSTFLPSDFSR